MHFMFLLMVSRLMQPNSLSLSQVFSSFLSFETTANKNLHEDEQKFFLELSETER